MKRNIIIGITIIVFISTLVFFINSRIITPPADFKPAFSENKPVAGASENKLSDEYDFPGINGKNALDVTKAHTSIEQDKAGLIISINGRKAEAKKREYWAFYINGKQASVGPADYITAAKDKIHWKIEKY